MLTDHDNVIKTWVRNTPYVWLCNESDSAENCCRFYMPSRDTIVYDSLGESLRYEDLLNNKLFGSLINCSVERYSSLDGLDLPPSYKNLFLVLDTNNKEKLLRKYEIRMNGRVIKFPSNFSFSIKNIRDYTNACKFTELSEKYII